MADAPRVRFAPAPTGTLHVGSAHTALFNWLFARHHGGEFVLRIEDTDVARSRDDWIHGIEDALAWLGLDWDRRPVRQSTRMDAYAAAAKTLLEEGRAYECYCTHAEVQARNEAARAEGRTPGYDGRCRDVSDAERARLAGEGRPRSIRFRTPDEGTSSFDDVIRGTVAVEWSTIPDFVVVRSDDSPVFFLANAVDDADMRISHVIRGEDLLDSTHRVLALRRALGTDDPLPAYVHLPLILGPDRSKLSKRHGAVDLHEFRDRGYLPEAVRNYLALLGWAPPDDREIMTVDELVAAFDLGDVTHAAGVFDHDKLDWMNGEYLRAFSLDELRDRLRPAAERRFGSSYDDAAFAEAVRIGQERAVTTEALLEQMEFLFRPDADFEIAPESWERLASTDRVAEVLDAAIAHLEGCDWTVEAIDLRPTLSQLGVKPRKVMPALYAAVEGRHAGLPLFDSMRILGRERALERLRAARARLDR